MGEHQFWPTHLEAMRTGTYIANLAVCRIINFGINFGFAWGSAGKYGRLQPENFEGMPVWYLNPEINSCVILDLMTTCFLMAFFTVLLGSNGIVQDIKDGKTRPVDTEVTKTWWWAWTPVRVEGICLRALLTAVQCCAVIGLPMTLLIFAGVQEGMVPGMVYVGFKGVFAFFTAFPIFNIMFFSASDSRNYVKAAYSALADGPGDGDIPLVGAVSRV